MATRTIKPVPKFYGQVVENDGHNVVKLQGKATYQRYIDTNFKIGQFVKVQVTRHHRARTTGKKNMGEQGNQNGYLYAVVLPMVSEVTGYTADEACSALESLLCTQSDNEYGMPRIKRFKDMTTVEFNEYVIDAANPNSVRSWALRVLEIDIPEPNKEYASGYGL